MSPCATMNGLEISLLKHVPIISEHYTKHGGAIYNPCSLINIHESAQMRKDVYKPIYNHLSPGCEYLCKMLSLSTNRSVKRWLKSCFGHGVGWGVGLPTILALILLKQLTYETANSN